MVRGLPIMLTHLILSLCVKKGNVERFAAKITGRYSPQPPTNGLPSNYNTEKVPKNMLLAECSNPVTDM